jgi:hypothetical protein
MARLALPTVTLCAAASVNVSATIASLRACLDQVDFAECLFFTDAEVNPSHPEIRMVSSPRLASAEDYSNFLLQGLVNHIRTDHCLIVQWDGFVLDAAAWDPSFLSFDYIGAPWPQFDDGHDVGNGGFSLRSRKLLEACRDPEFLGRHPEDVTICRVNRPFLEDRHGIRFADRGTAARFAFERTARGPSTFGFHGVFNMVSALGPDRFWEIYRSLGDRRTILADYRLLMGQLMAGRHPLRRGARLTSDMVVERLRRLID